MLAVSVLILVLALYEIRKLKREVFIEKKRTFKRYQACLVELDAMADEYAKKKFNSLENDKGNYEIYNAKQRVLHEAIQRLGYKV
jgi:predicted Holliday junction resolvase-like endonuclease